MNGKTFTRTMIACACLVTGAGMTLFSSEVLLWHGSSATNYPNPFDSRTQSTVIRYELAAEADVCVSIYDLFGNAVREYRRGRENPGVKTIVWDGTDETGGKVAKGGYLVVIRIGGASPALLATRKVGVIR